MSYLVSDTIVSERGYGTLGACPCRQGGQWPVGSMADVGNTALFSVLAIGALWWSFAAGAPRKRRKR